MIIAWKLFVVGISIVELFFGSRFLFLIGFFLLIFVFEFRCFFLAVSRFVFSFVRL